MPRGASRGVLRYHLPPARASLGELSASCGAIALASADPRPVPAPPIAPAPPAPSAPAPCLVVVRRVACPSCAYQLLPESHRAHQAPNHSGGCGCSTVARRDERDDDADSSDDDAGASAGASGASGASGPPGPSGASGSAADRP